jgi:hypothetical protein
LLSALLDSNEEKWSFAMKIDTLALLIASGLAVVGIEANGEGAASGQSGSVVRTQAQVFGDALDSSDPSNGGFWTISADRPAQTVSVASASKGGVIISARSRLASAVKDIFSQAMSLILKFR